MTGALRAMYSLLTAPVPTAFSPRTARNKTRPWEGNETPSEIKLIKKLAKVEATMEYMQRKEKEREDEIRRHHDAEEARPTAGEHAGLSGVVSCAIDSHAAACLLAWSLKLESPAAG